MSTVKRILIQVGAASVSLAICLAALAAGALTEFGGKSIFTVLAIVTGVLLALIAVVNIAGQMIVKKKFGNMRMREGYMLTQRLKAGIERDYRAAERSVDRAVVVSYAYCVFVIALAAAFCFSLGRACPLSVAIGFTIVAGWVCLGDFLVLFSPGGISAPPAMFRLPPEQYPLFYDTARRAADALGCKVKITLFDAGSGIFVAKYGNRLIVNLDYSRAALLTRDELYGVMLHEMAHYVNADIKRGNRYARIKNRWDTSYDNFVSDLSRTLFMDIVGMYIIFKITLYEMIATRHHEEMADEIAAKFGDRQAIADGFAKSFAIGEFDGMQVRELEYDYFEPEKPKRGFASEFISVYKQYLSRYKDLWMQRLKVELTANVDSHPTIRSRIAALGIDEFVPDREESDEAYIAECRRLVEKNDELIYKEMCSGGYEQHRQRAYTERTAAINAYRDAQNSGGASESVALEAALALRGVDDDEALSICDRLLSANPDAERANMYSASILYDRDDPECIPRFKKAAKSVYFYESAVDAIGKFALKTGNAELLAEYRATAPETMQEVIDVERENAISKAELLPHGLDKGVIDELVGDILECGKETVESIAIARYEGTDGKTRYPVAVMLVKAVRAEAATLYADINSSIVLFGDSYAMIPVTDKKTADRISRVEGAVVYKK